MPSSSDSPHLRDCRKVLQLITSLTPEQFGKLSASCVPRNPIDLDFEELLKHLRKLFKVNFYNSSNKISRDF